MPNKVRISQSDRERSTLTELIPYEVPLRFSYRRIYDLLKSQSAATRWVRRLFFPQKAPKDLIPYNYSIRRGEGKDRCLGLIHPLLFREFADFYADYGSVVIHLCGKSSWSLRRPSRIARTYFVKEAATLDASVPSSLAAAHGTTNDAGEIAAEEVGAEPPESSSFFAYEPHSFLHRFFESKDLLSLERRFVSYRRLDVAKCFSNIYTHSLSWAVKGKAAAKAEKEARYTFDGTLDRLMQRSNHGETHGILIGAEISRVFAEIIFQEIDARTEAQVSELKTVSVRDYCIRRYIDDYFVFFNDPKVANIIQNILELELSKYKLFVNEHKRIDCCRPFMTRISSVKVRLSRLVKNELDLSSREATKSGAPEAGDARWKGTSARMLKLIRLLLTEQDVEYSEISSFLMKHLHIALTTGTKLFKESEAAAAGADDWLRCILETAFFMFSVDVRFRTSVLLARIVSDANSACRALPCHTPQETVDVIIRESTSLLQQFGEGEQGARLELANYLICMRDIAGSERLPASVLEKLWLPRLNEGRLLDYFTSVSVLFFTGGKSEYALLTSSILDGAFTRLLVTGRIRESTELFSLALDLLSCPWAHNDAKSDVAKKMIIELETPNPTASEVGAFVNEISQRTWFFDWRTGVPTDTYLRKKELSLSY